VTAPVYVERIDGWNALAQGKSFGPYATRLACAVAVASELGIDPFTGEDRYDGDTVEVLSATWGTRLTREVFDAGFALNVGSGPFLFGNDARLGTCKLTADELWHEVQRALREYETTDANPFGERGVGSWLSDVVGCLGVEWI
jgi:hypothetical protein